MFGRRGRARKRTEAEGSRPPVTGVAGGRPAGRAVQADQAQPAEAADGLPAGPFDFAHAPAGVRLDLGSMLVPAVDGVEVRVQAGEDGVIQQVVLLHGENALQLGVFAAPRTEGLWDEVRQEIRDSLVDDGADPQEQQGRWGTELRARLRTQDGVSDLRFVGVDGPRWMVRVVFQGPAAVDQSLAGPLMQCLAGLVVRRDAQPRPVREPLPLRLPDDVRNSAAPQGTEPVPGEVAPPPSRPRRDG